MTSELKPCWHCPAEKSDVHLLTGALNRWRVKCEGCGNETITYPTRAEAVAAWNSRPGEDALRAEVEKTSAALRETREDGVGMLELNGKLHAEVARLRGAIQGFDNYLNPSIPFDHSKGDKIPVTSDEWYDQLRTKIRAALAADAEKG